MRATPSVFIVAATTLPGTVTVAQARPFEEVFSLATWCADPLTLGCDDQPSGRFAGTRILLEPTFGATFSIVDFGKATKTIAAGAVGIETNISRDSSAWTAQLFLFQAGTLQLNDNTRFLVSSNDRLVPVHIGLSIGLSYRNLFALGVGEAWVDSDYFDESDAFYTLPYLYFHITPANILRSIVADPVTDVATRP